MTVDALLESFGFDSCESELPALRKTLCQESEKETAEQGRGGTELMKLLCVYLFAHRNVEDSLLVWKAKTSSMDADCSIDVQLLCGAGLEKTKSYLESNESAEARSALERIKSCENTGDFKGFAFEGQMSFYKDYYGAEEDCED